MPPKLALLLCCLFIIWLFARSMRREKRLSAALWIPLCWTLIIGSKPISAWFGFGGAAATPDGYLEGSPFDRLFFLILISAGLFVIGRRRISWGKIIGNNKWLFVFFLYLGLSTLWSDYPFVSLKRWIKDFGNVIMVLVVLGEIDQMSAIRALVLRCSYVLIPLSVVFVKYFPELGRYYDPWTWTPHYGGVTTDKNLLGIHCSFADYFLCVQLIRMRREWKAGKSTRTDFLAHVVLLLMTFWLLSITESATAIACLFIGLSLFLALNVQSFRMHVGRIGIGGAVAGLFMLLAAGYFFGLGEFATGALGRDVSLTGRTEIWRKVLNEDVDPLLGAGFYSFWMGDRPDKISKGFYYRLNEAHNGYLDTYLNSGLLGVLLLLALLLSSMKRIQRQLLARSYDDAAMRLAFFLPQSLFTMSPNPCLIEWTWFGSHCSSSS